MLPLEAGKGFTAAGATKLMGFVLDGRDDEIVRVSWTIKGDDGWIEVRQSDVLSQEETSFGAVILSLKPGAEGRPSGADTLRLDDLPGPQPPTDAEIRACVKRKTEQYKSDPERKHPEVCDHPQIQGLYEAICSIPPGSWGLA